MQATFDVVLGVLLTGLSTYVVTALLSNKQDQRKQFALLARIAEAVLPEHRMGVVERVEIVERNVGTIVTELENHETVSRDQIKELKRSIRDLWAAVNVTRREGTA